MATPIEFGAVTLLTSDQVRNGVIWPSFSTYSADVLSVGLYPTNLTLTWLEEL